MSPRILIVDDEVIVAESTRLLLDGMGYEAMGVVMTPEDALAAVVRHRPDLVLVDINLRGKEEGIRLASVIRDEQRVPVVFVTACSDEATLRRASVTHPFGYVTKPFEGRDLRVAIEVALHNHGLEQRLLESERWLACILNGVRDAVVVADAETGRILDVNAETSRLVGRPRYDLIGRHHSELHPPEEATTYRDRFRSRAGVDQPGDVVAEVITADHRRVPVEIRASTIVLANGGRALVGVFRDVTERKRLEAQFLRSQRLESLGALASGIAHDLNNVLAPILMSIELLRSTRADEAEQQTLDLLRSSAQRGVGVVRQLLAFARGAPSQKGQVNPRFVLREIAQIVEETFPKHVRLHCEVAGPVWNLCGDATQVHLALLNLCVNAREAMPRGGKLTLRADNAPLDATYVRLNPEARVGRFVRLTVADTGTGIPKELQGQIFEPFFTTKPAGQGTGMGLPTVQSIVRSHEGFLELHSQVGSGTEFRVYLPAFDGPEEGASQEGPVPEPVRGGGQRILVVDDDEAVRTALGGVLRHHGYDPLVAVDGADALARMAECPGVVKAAVVDMLMPLMDGAMCIQALRRLDPGLPVVAISGLPNLESTARQTAVQRVEFLLKPFTAERLLTMIGGLLSLPLCPPR